MEERSIMDRNASTWGHLLWCDDLCISPSESDPLRTWIEKCACGAVLVDSKHIPRLVMGLGRARKTGTCEES